MLEMATPWSPIDLICRQLSCLLLLTCLLLAHLTSAQQQTETSVEVPTTDSIPVPTSTLHYGPRYPYRNTSFSPSFPPYTNTSRPTVSRTHILTITETPVWSNITTNTTYTTEIVTATYCPCLPGPHDPGKTTEMCSSSRTLTVTLTATIRGCMGSGRDKCTYAYIYNHDYPLPTHDVDPDSGPNNSYKVDDGEGGKGEYGNTDEEGEHKGVPEEEGGDRAYDNGDKEGGYQDAPEVDGKEDCGSGGEGEHQAVPEEEGGEEGCDYGDEKGEHRVVPEEEEEEEEGELCNGGDGHKDIPGGKEGGSEEEEEEEAQGKEKPDCQGSGKHDSGSTCTRPYPTLKATSSDLADYSNEDCHDEYKTKTPKVTASHGYPIQSSPKPLIPTSKEPTFLDVTQPETTIYTVTASITHPPHPEDKHRTVDSSDSDPPNTHKISNSSTTSAPTNGWTGPDLPTYIADASRFVNAPGKVAGQLGILMACIWVGFFLVGNHI